MPIAESLTEPFALLDVPLFEVGGTRVTLVTLLVFALILGGTFLTSSLVRRALLRVFRRRGIGDKGTVGVALRLLHYAILVVGVGVGLHTVGINLTALFAAGALLAVGVGFAMQNLSENFLSGIILLVERSIKPGDIIRVDDQMIRVREMGIRSTVARTLDEEDVIIPNSQLVQSTVINYTLRDAIYRLRAVVGVTYSSDMRQVRTVLERAADGVEWRRREQKPAVLLSEFGDSSVNWEVSVWIDDPWSMRRLRSQLHEAMWWALADAGITIAFPQLDVHFDAPITDSLARLERAV